jgi:hypothetical protein
LRELFRASGLLLFVMLRKVGKFVLLAFVIYIVIQAPAESGDVVTTVGRTAARGFEFTADMVVHFLRDHDFLQGG